MPEARKLILVNRLSPGDVAAMTAAIYSLHRQHPGKFVTAFDTTAPEIWQFNPDAFPLAQARESRFETVQTHYPLINQSNQRALHFMEAYCDYFENLLGVRVPLLTNKPMLYLSHQEKNWMSQVQEDRSEPLKFWIINAGHKRDFTCKFWGLANFQKVVDLLQGKVQFVQVGQADHVHQSLRGVIDLLGKTDCRQLIRLVWNSQGCLTGVSFLHHLAAAFDKPCVTLMGGREPVQWNSYPRCQLFHTVGALPCCRDGGCWKSRVVKLSDGSEQDNSLCQQTVVSGQETLPACMAALSPERVAEMILLYSS